MKHAWKLLIKLDFYFIALVILVTILAGRSLIFESGYFNMHDDLQMMRQLELEKCFQDRQIPCRWVPDLGYGFGYPLYNFYPQLPYLIGQIFRVVGLSFITTAKLTFALSFILSGIFMYLLSKEFFGRYGGLLAAVFFTWAPYHSVDIYVRGAMNEAWALVWYPAIFWASYKLINNKQKTINKKHNEKTYVVNLKNLILHDIKWIIMLALFWFALLNSHNLMVMILAPVFIVWILILLWQNDAWKKIPSLILSGFWALGLSAFFTLPVLFEQKYTWVEKITEGYYNYTVHFVNIRQLLLSRFWGYGPSTWLDEDRMSFQIGHLHWILSILIGVFILTFLVINRNNLLKTLKSNKFITLTLFMIGVGWFSAFMTHSRSTPIWMLSEHIQFLQFPWRFLTVTIFAFSFVVGAIPKLIGLFTTNKSVIHSLYGKWIGALIVIVLSLILIIWNWNYFTPEYGKMGPLTDEEKFSGAAWDKLQTAGIYDYLPLTADTAPKAPKDTVAEIIEGEGEIHAAEEGTYWAQFNADIDSEQALVRINILDFPDWRVFASGLEVEKFIPEEEDWGRMYIELPEGEYAVYAELYDTNIRSMSNIISLISWIILLAAVIYNAKLSKNNITSKN